METDYSTLSQDDFQKALNNHNFLSLSNLLSEMFPYAFVLKFIVVLYSEKLIAEFSGGKIIFLENKKIIK